MALSNLNHRLRTCSVSTTSRRAPDPGQVDLYFGFAAESAAQAFAEAVPSAGRTGAVDGRSYDDDTVALAGRRPLDDAARSRPSSTSSARRLLALAAERGGRDGGWGTPPP